MSKRQVVSVALVVVLLVGGYMGLKWGVDNYHLPEPVETFAESIGIIAGKPLFWKPVGRTESSPSSPASYAKTVKYSVTGNGSAMMTISNAQGGTEQYTKILPWSTSFKAEPGAFLYVSAQKQGDDARTMTVLIEVSGNVVRTSNTNAAYGIASADMILD